MTSPHREQAELGRRLTLALIRNDRHEFATAYQTLAGDDHARLRTAFALVYAEMLDGYVKATPDAALANAGADLINEITTFLEHH